MSDIIFCDICGKETKEQTLGGSVCFTRSVVACDECVVSNQDNLDKAMSVAFEEFMVSIRDLKGIEINQKDAIQSKIDQLGVQLTAIFAV